MKDFVRRKMLSTEILSAKILSDKVHFLYNIRKKYGVFESGIFRILIPFDMLFDMRHKSEFWVIWVILKNAEDMPPYGFKIWVKCGNIYKLLIRKMFFFQMALPLVTAAE